MGTPSLDGTTDGPIDGPTIGTADGPTIGTADGPGIGTADGPGIGTADGPTIGTADGPGIGTADGRVIGTADGSGEERLSRLLAVTREVLRAPGVAADDDLADHGGTSLSVVRIVAIANRTHHLDIDPRRLDGTVTVRALARVARPL